MGRDVLKEGLELIVGLGVKFGALLDHTESQPGGRAKEGVSSRERRAELTRQSTLQANLEHSRSTKLRERRVSKSAGCEGLAEEEKDSMTEQRSSAGSDLKQKGGEG